MSDIRIDDDFNIFFGNEVDFVDNDDMEQWKILLTCPQGSFARDESIGIDFEIVMDLARLDSLEGLTAYYLAIAESNNINIINVNYKINSNNELEANFLFSNGSLTIQI